MPRKLMVLAVLAILLLPSACSKDAAGLERYLNCAAIKKVDIVFVFDTSNSMGGEINELKAIANKFAADLKTSNIDYRLGLVEFRDFPQTCGEGDKIQCGSPGDLAYRHWGNGTITSDIQIFSSWLKDLKAGGGGEVGPEAILAALRHADSDMLWRDDAERAMIMLTDAGPHPDGSCCNAEGDTLEGTIFALTGQGTRVYVIGPDHPSLKKIAAETGGQFYKIRSGLSLRPILKEITQAMSCRFNVEVVARCLNKTLQAKATLVGNESIPYSAGQTEAWMYIDQAGEIARYNLSYNKTEESYGAEAPGVCGSLNLTVYGRVEQKSAVNTTRIECEPCQNAAEPESLSISGRIFDDDNGNAIMDATEPGLESWEIRLKKSDGSSDMARTDEKGFYIFTDLPPDRYELSAAVQMNWTATFPENGTRTVELDAVSESDINFGLRIPVANIAPEIADLTAEPGSPQIAGTAITWTANASDMEGDQLLYRFFLNGQAMTDWNADNTWIWTPAEDGKYLIRIELRDGKHAGPDESDDKWSYEFEINAAASEPAPESQAISWDRPYGGQGHDWGESVEQTADGGYIITGTTDRSASSGEGKGDVWLFKADDNGSMLWEKTFGGPEWDDGYCVQQTIDAGYIITGSRGGDLWLIKTDENGTKIWDRIFGGPREDWGESVQQTGDGGYIIAGVTDRISSSVAGSGDLWLIRTDKNGTKIWDRVLGESGADWGRSVQQTADGGYIVTGLLDDSDLWLIKMDENGTRLWEKTFAGTGRAEGYAVQQIPQGGYVIAGATASLSGNLNEDLWLIKTDENGKKLWDKTYGGSDRDWGESVQQTDDGGFIIAGITYSSGRGSGDLWLVRTDKNGTMLWDKAYGGANRDWGQSVRQTDDSGYIIAGRTESYGAGYEGYEDLWLIKTDEKGDIPEEEKN
ncbi:MAG: VWA domain-containing protein [Methanothrix sp.]|nr:VWA domain-containing protein [Methanothrix sp.]OYV11278.1 MAG: hypothetical protein CG446_816 [Methanosaeta sp. ASO1]